ncbi:MAG: hypothetical protein ACLTMP_03605 [Eggerthella lenta]
MEQQIKREVATQTATAGGRPPRSAKCGGAEQGMPVHAGLILIAVLLPRARCSRRWARCSRRWA